MNTIAYSYAWCCLALSGAAYAQTVRTVPADFTESLQLHYTAAVSHVEIDEASVWVGTQENDALQTIVTSNSFGPSVSVTVRRSFLEFTVPDVLGTATLVLEKYYDSGSTDPDRRILVSAYTPDDSLTTADFDRAVQDLGLLATTPSVGQETVRFDLTALLQSYGESRLGLRLSVLDETPGGFVGAAFKDAYLGAQPYIEIDESGDGTAVVCLPADLTESLQLHYQGTAVYENHEDSPPESKFIGTQQNDALQTIVSWSPTGSGAFAEVRRSFLEFELPQADGTVTLVLQKYYDSGNPDPDRRILVSAYTPDGDLTTDDFYRPVEDLGVLDTHRTIGQETVEFDLAALLPRCDAGRLGIRLSVLDETPGGQYSFAGAGFKDAYLGAQPYIEIVEAEKVVICHRRGGSKGPLTLSVAQACVEDHLGHGDTLGPCAL